MHLVLNEKKGPFQNLATVRSQWHFTSKHFGPFLFAEDVEGAGVLPNNKAEHSSGIVSQLLFHHHMLRKCPQSPTELWGLSLCLLVILNQIAGQTQGCLNG